MESLGRVVRAGIVVRERFRAIGPVPEAGHVDPEGIPQFGLVAEEVEKINPALVARDAQGKPYSVRYDAVNAMLLNEFLKEHKKVGELEATIAQQEKNFRATVAELNARLKEQDSKIEKVSAQVEVSKPAPQMAVNDQ